MGPFTNDVTSIFRFLTPPSPLVSCHPFYYICLFSNVTIWRTLPPPLEVTSFVNGPFTKATKSVYVFYFWQNLGDNIFHFEMAMEFIYAFSYDAVVHNHCSAMMELKKSLLILFTLVLISQAKRRSRCPPMYTKTGSRDDNLCLRSPYLITYTIASSNTTHSSIL